MTIAPLHVFPVCSRCGYSRRGEPRAPSQDPLHPPEEAWSHAEGQPPEGQESQATTFEATHDADGEAWPTSDEAPGGTRAWSDPSAVDEEHPAQPGRPRLMRAALASLGAALLGALVWGFAIRLSAIEWSWLALVVGALCGFAAFWGAGRRWHPAVLAIACVCTLLGVAGGKLLGSQWRAGYGMYHLIDLLFIPLGLLAAAAASGFHLRGRSQPAPAAV